MSAGHHSPLAQFEVHPLIQLPKLFGIDMSITNSGLFMLIAVASIAVFYFLTMRRAQMVPSRWQSFGEVIYQFTQDIVEENAGHAGMKYFPFIFSLFLFILFTNLIGMVPYSFTPTSHIVITLGMGLSVFALVVIVAIIKQGLGGFLKHFVPPGLPGWIIPAIFLIEIVSFLARPISLGIRLAANMAAGHTVVKVIAGFVVPLGIFGVLPISFLVVLTGIEIFVCILQAYVFTLLTCLYLGEALADHH